MKLTIVGGGGFRVPLVYGALLARRDRLDSSRTTSPLQAAADAVHLDSSTLSAADVVEHVLNLARRAGLAT